MENSIITQVTNFEDIISINVNTFNNIHAIDKRYEDKNILKSYMVAYKLMHRCILTEEQENEYVKSFQTLPESILVKMQSAEFAKSRAGNLTDEEIDTLEGLYETPAFKDLIDKAITAIGKLDEAFFGDKNFYSHEEVNHL